MGRAPCCDKENVRRGPWSPEEDAKLKGFIDKYGTGGNWIALPHKAGLKRCGKSCRLRWLNYLRPNIKHGDFTDDEDKIICNLYANIGSRWSIIAGQLPGRTDNDVKNHWNTKLKKKLCLAMLPSFQKKPSFFPCLPFNSPTPYTYTSHTVQDQINFTHDHSPPQPPPSSNSLISLITNNINNNNNSFLGFQVDHQSMYNHPLEYDHYPTLDLKEGILMFGSSGGEGYDVSTTGSSSEGGSCLSQISYGNQSQQIKKEDQFYHQGFGDQSQSFMLHGEVLEEVKQFNGNTNSSSMSCMLNDDDEHKTEHDHKEIFYHY